MKRHDQALVSYLTGPEVAALLDAPDRATWLGRRDHALLLVAVQCGLRVSELTGLTVGDVHLGTGAHLHCHGKGRKERATPLSGDTARALQAWMAERGGHPSDALFPTRQGKPLSTDAIEKLVAKHVKAAAKSCLSLRRKRVTPHTLRHSSAMSLLNAGLDAAAIALWLGHEQVQTTAIYFHADLTMKERALAMTTPPRSTPGRYRPPDPLLAFLESL